MRSSTVSRSRVNRQIAEVSQQMAHSAEEEIDHLAWCEQHLDELGGTTSALNPAWYECPLQ